MTPFPFPWRWCSVALVIWILMADTVHRPAARFQPHIFVYVEKHIKVNYYWEVAKSNMWCEEWKKKHKVSHFKVICPWMFFSKAVNNDRFLWCNVDIRRSAPPRWKIWNRTDSLTIKENIISLNSTTLCYVMKGRVHISFVFVVLMYG